jgi:tryptophan halogenase
MKKINKITILGAGNAACMTALHYSFSDVDEIEICYDPNIPIERVGQGTALNVTNLIGTFFNVSLYDKNNPIKATIKDGILYENWKDKSLIYHPFPLNTKSIHYVPQLLSKSLIESGVFKVKEMNVTDPEREIDSDYIFDCRGKHDRNPEDYISLINPLNAAILCNKPGRDHNLLYTRCVATPNGWTFVIPNYDSVSYGYLYNDFITSKEEAEKNFIDLFDVVPDGYLKFDNYIAKSMWRGERTILNGNKLSFLEPLEATSAEFYLQICKNSWDCIFDDKPRELSDKITLAHMKRIETFVLWHYQNGSKYNTPFWDYAKSLPFFPDDFFNSVLDQSRKNDYRNLFTYNNQYLAGLDNYEQWPTASFKYWDEPVPYEISK